MKNQNLLDINLRLFDGGATGGAAADGAGAANAAGDGSNQTGEKTQVIYGKQPEAADTAEPPAAGEAKGGNTPATLEERTKAFDEFIADEKYKDIFSKRTQELINRRFAQTKALERENARLKDIAGMLGRKYGLDANGADFAQNLKTALQNDNDLWAEQAANAGMSVEQYQEFEAMRRENAAFRAMRDNDVRAAQTRQQAEKWYNEAQDLAKKYPQFDLKAELADPNFVANIGAGVPMETAWKAKYYDRDLEAAAQGAARNAERQVVDNIRAKGRRAAENGANSQSAAFVTKNDPSKLTLADYEDIAKRVARGERIEF